MGEKALGMSDKAVIKTYRDLLVWQKSMAMVTVVYKLVKSFPKEELYALANQIKRSAVSVPSNIAEGFGRGSTNDYIRFLKIAAGSLYELQTQLEIAVNLSYLDKDDFEQIYKSSIEVEKMLSSLIRKLSMRSP